MVDEEEEEGRNSSLATCPDIMKKKRHQPHSLFHCPIRSQNRSGVMVADDVINSLLVFVSW